MQSHSDRDFANPGPSLSSMFPPVDFAAIKKKALEIYGRGESSITAGKEGEPVLGEWQAHGVNVTHRPNDETGCLRISVGGGAIDGRDMAYCVFRGNKEQCADLLRKAIKALESPRSI